MEGPVAPPPKLPSFKEMVKTKPTGESNAREEANSKIKRYTEEYESLKIPKKEEDKNKDKINILNRLSQFSSSPNSFDWFGIILDVLIVLLGITVVSLLFSKLFSSASEVVVESSDVTI